MKKTIATLLFVLAVGAALTPCGARPQRPPAKPVVEKRPPKKVFIKPGHRAPRLPGAAVRVHLGGIPYYYHAGVFYKFGINGYVVVTAPLGAVVPVLPVGFEVTVINGTTYYICHGNHYRRTHGGYLVVARPSVIVPIETAAPAPPLPPVAPSEPASSSTQSWTVWITNPNGSKTPVILKAADTGQWIGPKGEYYDAFPTQEQLLPVYGVGVQYVPAPAVPAVVTEATPATEAAGTE